MASLEATTRPAEASPSSTDEPTGQALGTQDAPDKQTPTAPGEQQPQPDSPATNWEKQYKELQAEFTRKSQAWARLGNPEQVQEQIEALNVLVQTPEVVEAIQRAVTKAQTGADDPETQRAYEIVQNIADSRVQQYIAPIQAWLLQQRINTTFDQMDKEFGKDWRQHRGKMREILDKGKQSGQFAPDVGVNFDYDFVKNLYLLARVGDPEYVAKEYEKRLKTKREASTEKDAGTPSAHTKAPKPMSMDEAYQQARRELGLT